MILKSKRNLHIYFSNNDRSCETSEEFADINSHLYFSYSEDIVIKTYSFDNAVVHQIPGDGHCLVNAVLESMRRENCLVVPSCGGLLEMLRYELLSNLDFYKCNMTSDMDVVSQLNDYIHHRKYGSDIVDIVLLAISNFLRITINVFIEKEEKYMLLNVLEITPGRTSAEQSVNILRSGDHFNAISFPLKALKGPTPASEKTKRVEISNQSVKKEGMFSINLGLCPK